LIQVYSCFVYIFLHKVSKGLRELKSDNLYQFSSRFATYHEDGFASVRLNMARTRANRKTASEHAAERKKQRKGSLGKQKSNPNNDVRSKRPKKTLNTTTSTPTDSPQPFVVRAAATETLPPRGFTFLAIGHSDLVQKCRELSKERNIEVRVVSVSLFHTSIILISTSTGIQSLRFVGTIVKLRKWTRH